MLNEELVGEDTCPICRSKRFLWIMRAGVKICSACNGQLKELERLVPPDGT